MTTPAQSEEVAPEVLRSPLWESVLERVETQVSGARARAGRSKTPSADAASRVLAGAHSRLLIALEGRSPIEDTVSELVSDAAELMLRLAALVAARGAPEEDERTELVGALTRRLSAHEHGVLAGEVIYRVRSADADQPAARIREGIAGLARDTQASHGDLVSLRIAAVDLAALLVRAAGNAAASGRADEAPEARSAAVDATLRAIVDQLAAQAEQVERPVDQRGDVAAHHLAAGLRVRACRRTLQHVSTPSDGGAADSALLDTARGAWLRLATDEYVAVTALERELETPTYRGRYATLGEAIVEGAANVICGARLVGRPDAFRHRAAWGHQAVALTYALEAYIAALRGHSPSFAQAQLIVLTRLIRAAAAIAALDLRRASIVSSNGASKPVVARKARRRDG